MTQDEITKRLERAAQRIRHEAALSGRIRGDRLREDAAVMQRAAQIARGESE